MILLDVNSFGFDLNNTPVNLQLYISGSPYPIINTNNCTIHSNSGGFIVSGTVSDINFLQNTPLFSGINFICADDGGIVNVSVRKVETGKYTLEFV